MRVGIISFAHMHAYSYASAFVDMADVELVAVADSNVERGQAAAAQFGAAFYEDYQSMLKLDHLDAVVVCSENALHKEHVVAAAAAKKHILCEKPIATNVADAWEMIRACEANDVILQIAFPVRFSPSVHHIKRMIDNGDLGRVVSMVGTNRGTNPGGWFTELALSGGGAVLDHTVHVLDVMRFLLGTEVREVYAEVGSHFAEGDFDDCGLLMLEFENGVYASHDPSWNRSASFPTWGDVTLEVVGTGGVTRMDVFGQRAHLFDDATGKLVFRPWGDNIDALLMKSFVDAVHSHSQPLVTGLDGLRAMEVALAAYESARTGKPVRIG